MSAPPAVVVTGIGAYTAVGRSSLQTFTSCRARLNRYRTWPHLGIDLPGAEAGGLPTASPIDGLGDAPWPEKAESLMTPPLEEALSEAGFFGRGDLLKAYGRVRIFGWIAIPPESRPGVERASILAFASDAETHCVVDVPATGIDFVPRGHASGLIGAEAALAALREGRADVCVLGGIDSLLESACLADLLRRGALKTEAKPNGCVPGEGAAFVVLETEEGARRRGANIHARLLAAGTAEEPVPYDGKEPLTAAALSGILTELLTPLDPETERVGDVFVDLNGERGRFAEWALADARCLESRAHGFALHPPAESTGDLGAVTGVLNLGLAARLISAGRSRRGHVLVCGMSDTGERAAALLGPAGKGG